MCIRTLVSKLCFAAPRGVHASDCKGAVPILFDKIQEIGLGNGGQNALEGGVYLAEFKKWANKVVAESLPPVDDLDDLCWRSAWLVPPCA
jgi:hypothetical protein